MEYKLLDQVTAVAQVASEPPRPMSREERIKRWIDLLDADPQRTLLALLEVEYLPVGDRLKYRSEASPLTVAYEDPVLRAQGLRSDSFGDALTFFELSERQLHHAFCSCIVGARLTAGNAALRLRGMLRRERMGRFIGTGWQRMRQGAARAIGR
jgi:hypothetical protein